MIRTTAVGGVTLQEVVDHFRTLGQDPELPDRLDVFLDLSGVESIPETTQIPVVIAELKRVCVGLRFDACAILAKSDALFGMMRMFEAYSEGLFQAMRTFRDPVAAEEWLELQRLRDGHEPEIAE